MVLSIFRGRASICFLTVFALVGGWLPNAVCGDESVQFNRDVQPILSANCFFCHGPDDKHREADLRLDTEEGIRAAFVAGKPQESEAWLRIISTDEDERMPPRDSHKELLSSDIETVRRWIEQGAAWQGHWAFIAPEKPSLPKVAQRDWIANPIDAFILARLEREKLAPTEPADRERLLRRVTFDLTGLPPTIAEIDAFLADTSPQAYEKAVDRLLASEHYGERMALIWMDAARYGDSSVFHADGPRDMWAWRDWVINAYNNNKPFDQFTIEQLAGDLLPEATLEQKIATAFNRNNATTDEGGVIAEEFRVEYAVDRVKTTSMVWLGLTMECGQCHDHKYDPISQTDYYRFYAYFNQAADPGMQTRKGNQTPTVEIPDMAKLAQLDDLKKQTESIEAQLTARATAASADFQAWLAKAESEQSETATMPGGMLAHYQLDESQGVEVLDAVAGSTGGMVQGKPLWSEGRFGGAFQSGDGYVDLGDACNFERDQAFSYGAWLRPEGKANGAAIARMDDGAAYRGYDLFCTGGKVAVHIINTWPSNALKVTTKAELKPNQWQHVFVTYDGSSKASGVKIYFDGQSQEWGIEQDRLSDTIRTGKPLHIGRRNPSAAFRGLIDDVRFFGRALSEAEVGVLAGSDPIAPILALPADKRSEAQAKTLRDYYLHSLDPAYQQLEKQLAEAKKTMADANKPVTTVMVMQDTAQPRMTYVLDRGNYASPDKDRPVEPGVLSFLAPLPEGAPANRLGMAQWLTDPQHPLTARVAVNRYWYMLFGAGLVKTVEDFGSQGDRPSHPALLDWLAVDFMEHGWNVKRMLKQMVMSNTYRQSSRVSSQLSEADPENRLLGRGPRFRLMGEMVRDNALAASGLLIDTVGGPSVKPYQPPGLWIEVSLSGARFAQDKGDKLYRRSMYTYWKRSSPAPSLTIFDTPTREKCIVRRSRTNTPLQALVTMNDPQYLEASRALAERVIREAGPTVERRITLAHRLATGLRPSAETLSVLTQAYEEELAVFQADVERAKKLLAAGDSPRDEKIDAAEHAALSIVM
ncbi:MAG: DUF1553 domain-containing protein, partial [Planctomycetales bacterium]|nr:DUF1553 domain-containing protein [Planctomycetales bacterium]